MSDFRKRLPLGIALFAAFTVSFMFIDAVPAKILYTGFALLAISEWRKRWRYVGLDQTLHILLLVLLGTVCMWNVNKGELALIAISATGYDGFAYVCGKLIGGKIIKKRPFPVTSKNKTWEGCIIGIVSAFGMCLLLRFFLTTVLHVWQGVFPQTYYIDAAGGVLALVGDYYGSRYKRDLDIVDSGTEFTSKIFGAHGGAIDRFLSHYTVASFASVILLAPH